MSATLPGSIPYDGGVLGDPAVRRRNRWKMWFFVLLTVFFLTLIGLGLAIDSLRASDARFIRNEQVQRFQLCFTREQTATSKQRTAAEKRDLIKGIDAQLRKIHVPPCRVRG